jgi:hypothetical protein
MSAERDRPDRIWHTIGECHDCDEERIGWYEDYATSIDTRQALQMLANVGVAIWMCMAMEAVRWVCYCDIRCRCGWTERADALVGDGFGGYSRLMNGEPAGRPPGKENPP